MLKGEKPVGKKIMILVALALILFICLMLPNRYQSGHKIRVADNVQMALSPAITIDIGGYGREDLQIYLEQSAEHLNVPPCEPSVDPVTAGVVPGLAGQVLDIERTIEEALVALPGACVQASFLPVLPAPLEDYADYPIYQGNPAKRQIALVINVAWGNEHLVPMLSILRDSGVQATWFLVGRWAAKYPELVRLIAAEGHEFGNHAYSDPHLPTLSKAAIADEINKTAEVIVDIVGTRPRYFSPPYNDFNQTVLDIAQELGYLTVICSLDTADWMRPGVGRIVARIVPKAHNGGIVLMHPTEQTPPALKEIVSGLLEQGYELVTLSNLLSPIGINGFLADETLE